VLRRQREYTPLYVAAQHGNTEMLKQLLEARANINARDRVSVQQAMQEGKGKLILRCLF
jgi:ankyrin repeat protein